MTEIFCIANLKGGVGKTTTAVTLGHGCALQGIHTLIVDTDPQGHVAVSLGIQKANGLFRLLVEEEPLEKVTVNARRNLDIVPSDKSTEKAKRLISIMDYREHVIASALNRADYDLILLDMAPSIDVLHVAALAASDWLIIPTKLDGLAIDGVNEILRAYMEIARQGGELQGYSILPTFFDRVTKETLIQFQAVVKAFPDRVWPPIPQDVKAREAIAYGKTLWEYAPLTPAMIGYTDRQQLGGYRQALDRLLRIYHGK